MVIALGGCASSGYERDDDESEFHKAAVSWVGAQVNDMITRWGEPTNLYIEATDERDGLARWRSTNNTAASGPGMGAGTRYYTCIAEARYGTDGVITKVDTVSSNCDKLFDEDHMANLVR
jgi:hypothetical protein